MSKEDLIGKKFGRWTVIENGGRYKNRAALWLCECECELKTQRLILGNALKKGLTKSCGCYNAEVSKERFTTHGCSYERLFSIWSHMNYRCSNEKDKKYHNYGGRGITVCDEWKYDYNAFKEWSLVNGYKDKLQLDRANNDQGYSPDNCRWVTCKQNSNNKRDNRFIEINGLVKTIAEWSELSGLKWSTISSRIKMGWKNEELLIPLRSHKAVK